MEEKLKTLVKMRDIQSQVITLRTEVPPIYGQKLKEEASIILKNLVSCEVNIDSKQIEPPRPGDIDVDDYKTEPIISIPALNVRTNNLAKCLELYKRN